MAKFDFIFFSFKIVLSFDDDFFNETIFLRGPYFWVMRLYNSRWKPNLANMICNLCNLAIWSQDCILWHGLSYWINTFILNMRFHFLRHLPSNASINLYNIWMVFSFFSCVFHITEVMIMPAGSCVFSRFWQVSLAALHLPESIVVDPHYIHILMQKNLVYYN